MVSTLNCPGFRKSAFIIPLLLPFCGSFTWQLPAQQSVPAASTTRTSDFALQLPDAAKPKIPDGVSLDGGVSEDDAIIDVENIMRRLRLNRALNRPEPVFQVVLKASIEVRSAIVYATLIVVMVFVPVFFLGGLSGAFFRPLAVLYVLAVLASLGVALTLTPALSLLLLPRAAEADRKEPPLSHASQRATGSCW